MTAPRRGWAPGAQRKVPVPGEPGEARALLIWNPTVLAIVVMLAGYIDAAAELRNTKKASPTGTGQRGQARRFAYEPVPSFPARI